MDRTTGDPVFIVGVPRSGTTLLLRTLLRHRSFAHAHPRLAESNAIWRLYEFVNPAAEPAKELTRFLATEGELPADVRETVARLRMRRRIVRRLANPQRTIRSPKLWKLAGEHLVVRAFFDAAARLRGTRVVEKTPAHIRWITHLRIAYPGAHFVGIVRHPVDGLSSFWRRYQRQGQAASWANVAVDDFATQWASDVQIAEDLSGDDDFLLLRYEDLVADPESALRAVCGHIREAFDPTCLTNFEESATAQREGADSASASRWQDNVSVADASRLEQALAEPMLRFGYEAYAPTDEHIVG